MIYITYALYLVGVIILGSIILSLFKIVRPTQRGLVETLGKYSRFANPGFNLVIPFIQKIYLVNITEQMVDAKSQEIITNDNLNVKVDAQIYFKVKPDEESVKNSVYNINDFRTQIVALSRTTLRNIIGNLSLKSANNERSKINNELLEILKNEASSWGVDIIRAELKEISPPKDVQETMNQVVKAENEKIAAVDFATAQETKADGAKRASIKEAEGIKQAKILEAEGEAQAKILKAESEAQAIKLVNESAEKYFVGNAQVLRKLEAVETSLKDNAKVVVPSNTELVNVVGELAGVMPLRKD
jgi:regulator of protease activity HflC (stomatin/prohibitin superfamily)